MALHTISLPDSLYQRLEQQAKKTQNSIDDWVQQTLSRNLPPLVQVEDDLPVHLRVELLAMESLSDMALWSLARITLSEKQLAEWDRLHDLAQERELTSAEEQSRQQLSQLYDETILRRSHAAMLLHSRGYDLSDLTTLNR